LRASSRFLQDNEKNSNDESAWWPENARSMDEYNKYYLSKFFQLRNLAYLGGGKGTFIMQRHIYYAKAYL
jgi:hypothetical protein